MSSGLAPTPYKVFSQQYQPRASAIINGIEITPQSFSVTSNAHGSTDTATIVAPISNGPDWTVATATSGDAPVYVTILCGFAASGNGDYSQLTPIFTGVLDTFTASLERDEIVFTCRNLAAPLISTKIATPFAGESMTTQAFIQQQASRFGLQTVFNAYSYGTMLQVLGSEFQTGVKQWVIWDLMLQCAQYDDVDIWVDLNGVLHYESPGLIKRQTNYVEWGTDIKSFSGGHASQFSKNIRVEVRSWTKKTRVSTRSRASSLPGGLGGIALETTSAVVTTQPIFGTLSSVRTEISSTGKVTTTSATNSGGKANSGFTNAIAESGKETYIFYKKNATPQECDDLAQKIWRQITMHEYQATIVLVATPTVMPTLNITSLIRVLNAPYATLNGLYWPREITLEYSTGHGLFWKAIMVNHQLPQGAV